MMHMLNEKLSRILELGTFQTKLLLKIVNSLFGFSLIHHLPLHHQEKSIEHLVYLVVGLVDSHDDCPSLIMCQLPKIVDNDIRSKRIQTRGRLVKHDDLRLADKLKTNRCPFLFSS